MLPMNFDAVLAAFAFPGSVAVTDALGRYEAGVWMEEELGKRKITAVVLAMKTADLEFFSQGAAADAGITLTTRAVLYFTDVKDSNGAEGMERRQSYVDHAQRRWRVAGEGLMLGNAAVNMYHALRYIQ